MSKGGDSLPSILNGVNDIKGQFYGKNTPDWPVTVFHIENFYAYVWKLTCGLITKNSHYLVKMTPSTKDSSQANDYNFDGTGYIDTNISVPEDSDVYIKGMTLHPKHGMFPSIVSGASATTYFCDVYIANNSIVGFARVGGDVRGGLLCGVFAFTVAVTASNVSWPCGVALSFK